MPIDTTYDSRDPYRVLGVATDVSPIELRKAYLALARKHHPNLFATDPDKYRSSTVLMQAINGAYDLLSDPIQRELWDRKHLSATKTVPGPKTKFQDYYNSSLVDSVIRSYNEFWKSLRTEKERLEAGRRIKKFQNSREGSAFIRSQVAKHYRRVIDLVKLGREISLYDDGLVEIMFLYTGAIEVSTSDVFVTYAYVVYRGERQKARSGAQPRMQQAPWSAASEFAKDLRDRVRDWLVSSYRPRRK